MYRNNKGMKIKGLFSGIILCLFIACGGGGDGGTGTPSVTQGIENLPTDTLPSFGSETIAAQIYIDGIAITALDLPKATGGDAPLTYSIDGLPMGLELAGDQVVGTPTEVVTRRTVAYTVKDVDEDEVSLIFTITVFTNDPPDFGSGTVDPQNYIDGIAIQELELPEATGGNGALTYSIDPASPFGLTFDPSTRRLSGTPTGTGGPQTITYKVGDADGNTTAADEDTITFTVTVIANDPPDFGSGTIDDQSYIEAIAIPTLTLPQATGGNGTLTYSIAPASPFGLTFDPSTRELSGTPSGTGMETIMYKAVDGDGDRTATDEAMLTFTITVVEDTSPNFDGQMIGSLQYVPNSAITPVPLPQASGGNPPLRYSLTTPPAGLTFNADTRVLSGTPSTTLGSTDMTYTARDVDGDETMLTFTIEIIEDAMPGFAGQTIDYQQYVQNVAIPTFPLPAATGGNGILTYSLAPLPGGILFNSGTRELSGSPTTVGSTSLTYTARDEDGDEEMLTFMINVAADTNPSFGTAMVNAPNFINGIAITPLDLPEATGGNPPLEYSLSGQPAGLRLESGQLVGTPTEVVSGQTATYTATDVDGDVVPLTFMITVAANTPPSFADDNAIMINAIKGIAFTTEALPEAQTQGNGASAYSVGSLPAWLTFTEGTRTLSGTPPLNAAATTILTYRVHDADGDTSDGDSDTLTVTINVAENTPPTFANDNAIPINAIKGIAFTTEALPEAQTQGNGASAYSVESLPVWLTFTEGTRTLSGTPPSDAAATTTLTYRVHDADGDTSDGDSDTLTVTINVAENDPPDFGSAMITDQNYLEGIAIEGLELPEATVGNGASTYSIDPVSPFGLTFNSDTRTLSGTPAGTGMATVTYKAVDGDGDMSSTDESTLTFTITVTRNDPPDFGSETIDNQNYLQRSAIATLTLPVATGGNGTITYSLAPTADPEGTLPSGLSFDPNSRELSGTPNRPGTTPMTYTARDADRDMSSTDEATLTFNITVMSPIKNICDRTQQVEDAILAKIRERDSTVTCDTVTEQHLAQITGRLSLSDESITSLQSDDFDGLSSLGALILNRNDLTVLPSDVFDGLSSLTELNLSNNDLTVLPSDVFDGLSSLTVLNLSNNDLMALPADIFDGLSSLTQLAMWSNDLTDLPADVFDGLSSLTHLFLNDNDLTILPSDLFDGLSSLTDLDLRKTSLDSIPAICSQSGVTCQISADTNPSFGTNTVPDQSYMQGTMITPLTLPRASGGNGTLTYSLAPTSDSGGMPPTGLLLDLQTRVLSGIPTAILLSTDFTYTARDEDGDTDTIMFSIEVAGRTRNICGRTQQIEDAILAKIHETDNTITCDSVPELHFLLITELNLRNSGITSLQSDDFDGLSVLDDLDLRENSLAALPADVFDGLSNLEVLDLDKNSLAALPADVFDGLSSLTDLDLRENSLTALPAGVFDELSNLQKLYLRDNDLTTLPTDMFAMLSNLRVLDLHDNDLTNNEMMTALPADAFDGLSSLTELNLSNNSLSTLPAGVWNGLSSLTTLHLNNNSLRTLPANVFDGLSSLTSLSLWSNSMNTITAGAFNGLSSLTTLWLNSNSLSTLLHEDVFDGLSSLRTLTLASNRITALPANLFEGLSNLRSITLERNTNLANFPDGLFDELSSLRCLDLRRTAAATSPPDICSNDNITCDARCR